MKKLSFVLTLTGIAALLLACLSTGTASPSPVPPSAVPPTAVVSSATDTAVPPTTVPTATSVPPTATSSVAMLTPLDKDVNCRYGPGVDWASVGGLKVGSIVPILGTLADQSWWQIQNPQEGVGFFCWVGTTVVQTMGDLSKVPIKPIPAALVTDVSVDPIATIHGFCGGPNAFDPQGSITTNGPASVTFHWVILYNGGAYHATSDTPLSFSSAATKTDNPGSDHGDCGTYTVKLVVTSPNAISAQQTFKVVQP